MSSAFTRATLYWNGLILALLFPFISFPNDLRAGETLRIAVNANYPPWLMKVDGGACGGIDVGVMQSVAERMNLKPEIMEASLDQCQDILRSGAGARPHQQTQMILPILSFLRRSI